MRFGRLSLTHPVKPISDINMTPLVDVMLVLVVLFMITAPLMTSAIKLDLPQTNASNPVDTPKFVTVIIDKNGQLYFNTQSTNLAQLAEALTQIALVKSDTEVQLRADETVAYGKVAAVMGVAQQAGLQRVGLINESKPQAVK